MNLLSAKYSVHVEICLKPNQNRLETLEELLDAPMREYLSMVKVPLGESVKVEGSTFESNSGLKELQFVESILIECEAKRIGEFFNDADLKHLILHFYCPHRRLMELETFDVESGDAGDGDAVPASSHWLLPSNSFLHLWENLIYEDGLKEKLLKFALSALIFSQHSVNPHIISCNRLLLLHGPPGTGKTSLCKALAQKLAIRVRRTFRHTHLIEINSHSLFSKWFSESGKLVMRLFAKIREIVIDPNNLVCVLIDEVESLAYARDCMSGQEPKDAMRVVNALLTQLDAIKEHPNVLILATSNLAETIDLAFLDRADIKQYIGLPSAAAVKRIYVTMLTEMMRIGIINEQSLTEDERHEGLLSALAERSNGLSGRTLRKLPFLAHAVHTASSDYDLDGKIRLSDFLDAMLAALEQHHCDQKLMKN
ncbi:PREDICTED: pachytene checkpoint protein 2 homolog [Rhagoletis zephyria]|uniref:pachytene checkpoint protein 2 homolog n=1 Tax=Rhagoletis zephyria TaxID=28612 RepID=UPI0008116A44|nr:PREDICTED: pachytene checkpoint protein 2 homolog [Rhagoletis zephyria]